jgi:GDP-L-fucose synthase
MNKNDKIYVAGSVGLVGSSICRLLKNKGFTNVITMSVKDLDLRDQSKVNTWFEMNKPDYVFLTAAKVGGIVANSKYPANFLYDNLMIESNVIHASYLNKVKKLLFLGSSCIYPKENPIPIKEDRLLMSPLEPTNEGYALAKIVGLKLCEYYMKQYNCNFISAMPCNLYGPNDRLDLETSHVIPALITKFHNAKVNSEKEIQVWGTGIARREFLYVDDLVEALYFLMENYDYKAYLNIGCGSEVTMKELFDTISEVVNYKGELKYDTTKPDGTISKLIDSTKIRELGWSPKIGLKMGLENTYNWYINNLKN